MRRGIALCAILLAAFAPEGQSQTPDNLVRRGTWIRYWTANSKEPGRARIREVRPETFLLQAEDLMCGPTVCDRDYSLPRSSIERLDAMKSWNGLVRTAVVAATTAAGFAAAYFGIDDCRGSDGTFSDTCNVPVLAASAGGFLVGIVVTRNRWVTVLPER